MVSAPTHARITLSHRQLLPGSHEVKYVLLDQCAKCRIHGMQVAAVASIMATTFVLVTAHTMACRTNTIQRVSTLLSGAALLPTARQVPPIATRQAWWTAEDRIRSTPTTRAPHPAQHLNWSNNGFLAPDQSRSTARQHALLVKNVPSRICRIRLRQTQWTPQKIPLLSCPTTRSLCAYAAS